MKYKTTIKLTTEAKDKNEAMDIAGEYLSGNIVTGVDMKLRTVPASADIRLAGVALALLLIAGLSIASLSGAKHTNSFLQSLPGNCAIQPPLKTSSSESKSAEFKKEWQSKHTQEVFSSLEK